jgi:hypothetical protein
MIRAAKTVDRMRDNPRDWRIEDLISIADRVGLDHRQPGTSHVVFSFPGLAPLSVPARKPIKPVYVRLFVKLIDQIEEMKP